jgi:site-specific DNA recombinase
MPGELAADISARLSDAQAIIHSWSPSCRIAVPLALPLRGGKRLIVSGTRTSHPDPTLIAGLRKAHSMVGKRRGQPIIEAAPASRYEREVLRLAFLAPDLQHDILSGQQPPTLTLEKLRHLDIPLCWKQQRQVLGWS